MSTFKFLKGIVLEDINKKQHYLPLKGGDGKEGLNPRILGIEMDMETAEEKSDPTWILMDISSKGNIIIHKTGRTRELKVLHDIWEVAPRDVYEGGEVYKSQYFKDISKPKMISSASIKFPEEATYYKLATSAAATEGGRRRKRSHKRRKSRKHRTTRRR
jgi:hypothetical protein